VAGGVGDERTAIEDELVVAADGVDVHDGAIEFEGRIGHQFLPDGTLAVMPRTGRDVDHQIAALRGELPYRIETVVQLARRDHGMRPDVLANGDTDALTGVFDHGGRGRGLEIAVLVEDVVGGQQAFGRNGAYAPPQAEGGGVVKRPALTGKIGRHGADERGYVAHGGGNLRKGFGGVGHEVALEQQVARRIAADDQFRENHEFRTLGHERGVGVENLAAIAGKIADGRVELGETDAHGSRIKEATWRGFGGMTTPRLAPGASPRLPTGSHG
jgi:hypothetical protein